MLVLGIESSCDETAAAVVRDGVDVASSVVFSQTELHGRFRGVVPEVASRSHTTKILPVIAEALDRAAVQPEQLDAVAVTSRPGMIGCLLVGVTAAKALSLTFDLPLVGVDHIQAHIHAAFMTDPDMPLPAIALVASGGHTALYRVDAPGSTERLGTTNDDAAGEALDKAAAMLGLPYPGGPAIQKVAVDGNPKALKLPRPRTAERLDFSFSGMKTSLLYHLRGPGLTRPMPDLETQQVADLAASYQQAVVDCLIDRLVGACETSAAKTLSIGGGVARNALLREQIAAHPKLRDLRQVFPPMDLCSDNAAMVAGLGTLHLQQGTRDGLELSVRATARRKGS